MMRNLVTSLVLYEQVETTEAKAKELKSFADKLIARAKKSDLTAIRTLHKVLYDRNAVKKVIEVLVPRYATRTSGFTRSYHLKNRPGDNAPMMRLELIDKKTFVDMAKVAEVEKPVEVEKPKKNKKVEENAK